MEEWSKNMRALFDREWLYIYVGIIKYVNIGREKKLSIFREGWKGNRITNWKQVNNESFYKPFSMIGGVWTETQPTKCKN